MHGNESGDVVSGDNARIARQPAAPAASAATLWVTDPNTDVDAAGDRDPVRSVQLFDLDKVGSATPSATTSGGDGMFGDDGRDIMAGQGGNDTMSGGEGVDYMAGIAGADTMSGDGGEDDMIGGSSAGNGLITDVLPAVQRGTYSSPRDMRDGNDTMTGNLEDDTMVGDNASVARPERVSGSGLWWRLTNANFDLARRIVTMEKTPEAAGAFGDDTMSGGEAVDDLYGQLGNDTMSGNEGEDAMVGDLGQITNNLIDSGGDGLPDPGTQQFDHTERAVLRSGRDDLPDGLALPRGRALRLRLAAGRRRAPATTRCTGGDGADWIHGGPGSRRDERQRRTTTTSSATTRRCSRSRFTRTARWAATPCGAARATTRCSAGYGVDFLDVLPRPRVTDKKVSFPADPARWSPAAGGDAVQPDGHAGAYSGWRHHVRRLGPRLDADRRLRPGRRRATGQSTERRASTPTTAATRATATGASRASTARRCRRSCRSSRSGMGAVQTSTAGTSGYDETAMVFPGDQGNPNPVNPDNPAHFTCGVPHS